MPKGSVEGVHSGVTPGELTHVDGAGRARMVDVTGKAWTHRRAVARCRVNFPLADLLAMSGADDVATTPVSPALVELLGTARRSGIQAAKRTAQLIPLCHPLAISAVDLRLDLDAAGVAIEGTAEVVGPTGVEMEALTACVAAALTLVAAIGPDLDVSIEDVTLWEKSGGRSGHWVRP